MLFSLGKAMSGAPKRIGTNQLPNPPIRTGMTIKKIIRNACAVTTTLYSWWFPMKKLFPGEESSRRMKTESTVPITPENAPKIKYRVPISLWFVEKSHLSENVIFKRKHLALPFYMLYAHSRTRTENAQILSLMCLPISPNGRCGGCGVKKEAFVGFGLLG